MGGAAGHIAHLFEDHDLKVNELVDLMVDVTLDKKPLYEKFDGINLLFSLNERGQYVFARSLTDIDAGGLTASQLATRFPKWPIVAETVSSAAKALDGLRLRFFPEHGWGSLDVLSPETANVIRYDRRAVVIHPVVVSRGYVSHEPEMTYIDGDTIDGWSVCGPRQVTLTTNVGALNRFRQAIDVLLAIHGLGSGCTLGDVYAKELEIIIDEAGIGQASVMKMVIDRLLHRPGAPTLTEIKKRSLHSDAQHASRLINDERAVLKRARKNVEMAVHALANGLLDGVSSSMVSDLEGATVGTRKRLTEALQRMRDDGKHGRARQLQKLIDPVKDINTSMEGVVLFHGERCYKLTGSFALVNQVLGEDRYGRPLKIDQT